jgi:hypothetical protein
MASPLTITAIVENLSAGQKGTANGSLDSGRNATLLTHRLAEFLKN